MQLVVAPTPEEAAALAARHVADALKRALLARGKATLALSGGESPRPFFAGLARASLDWPAIHVFQVDERVAPRGDAARNLAAIETALPRARLHAMPVELAGIEAAADAYARELEAVAGRPPVLDVAHLGLGADGHTASLFPGDPVLDVADRLVAATAAHAGFRRLTLTLPVINAAREVVWFVTGAAKRAALTALLAGRAPFPAGRVARVRSHVFADGAAAAP